MTEPTEPSAEQQTGLLWDYLKGFHAVHLIDIGAKLGLLERIGAAEQGIQAAALAEDAGLHAHYVDIWCRTAYAYGILEADEAGNFRLAPHMDTLLVDRRHPRFLAPYFTGATSFFAEDFARYPDYFRSGAVHSFQAHGVEFSDGIASMTSGFHNVIARKMLPSIPGLQSRFEEGARVLDMGCGAGGLLIRIAQAHENAVCLGVDVDAHGIDLATANIETAGLSDRVSVELTDGDSISHTDDFDVAILFEVLHEIPVVARPAVLANCFQALKPGAPLFILDETYPSTIAGLRDPAHALAVQTAFNELIWGNIVPTAEEQNALLSEAGFVRVHRMQVAGIFTAITAWKPGGDE